MAEQPGQSFVQRWQEALRTLNAACKNFEQTQEQINRTTADAMNQYRNIYSQLEQTVACCLQSLQLEEKKATAMIRNALGEDKTKAEQKATEQKADDHTAESTQRAKKPEPASATKPQSPPPKKTTGKKNA